MTFKSLHITPHNENNLNLCRRYAEKFGAGSQNLLLWGNHGTGKTAAAEAIAAHLITCPTSVVMMTFADLLKAAHDAVFVDEVSTADLLIIDDLKPVESTTADLEAVCAIFERRTANALPTIFTTALTPYQLQNVCADLFSRIFFGVLSNAVYGPRLASARQKPSGRRWSDSVSRVYPNLYRESCAPQEPVFRLYKCKGGIPYPNLYSKQARQIHCRAFLMRRNHVVSSLRTQKQTHKISCEARYYQIADKPARDGGFVI